MSFIIRDIDESDLEQCMMLTTDRFLYDEPGRAAMRRMWAHLVSTKSGVAAVIVDANSPSRVMHFAVTVFVTDDRAQGYHRLACPTIARAMVVEFESGGQPFLSRQEIAKANARSGLNLLVSHHGYIDQGGELAEKLRAATYELARKTVFGWNLLTYTNAVFAKNALRDGKEMGEALGFRVERYSDGQLRDAGILPEQAPWVWLATREEAIGRPGKLEQAVLFLSFSPPKFGFNFQEQDTLNLALNSHTDETISRLTGASLSTIKKRFRSIYDKVNDAAFWSQVAPSPAPAVNGTRGAEMRRSLVSYLKDHPEELRPYAAEHGNEILHTR